MGMVNQRAEGQEFIGIWVTSTVAQKIELARGTTPRSQWLRDAIAELLRAKGFEVTIDEISAPSRVRRIPSQRQKYQPPNAGGFALNEKKSPSPDPTSLIAKKIKEVENPGIVYGISKKGRKN